MPTAPDIQAAIALLELCNRDAVRLGELVSLAARIEPELLRAVRLDLTPFDAAAEADLWFSPLVETRTADWIALDPAAARELRLGLAADQSRLDAAHALLMEAHSSAPATIILEEEIVWLALSAPPDARQAIESCLRLALDKVLEDPSAHRGIAHWFASAARRLPQEAQATESYALLCFVTSGLLDGRRVNAADPALPPIDALADIFPASIPKLRLWATLTGYDLTFRPNKVPGFVPLEVPRTDPLLFELRPLNEPRQFITLRRGETKTVRVKSRVVELRTAAGDAYWLRYRSQKLTSAGMQGLIMGFGGTGAYILTALKELAVLKHGRVPEALKFLLFDTIADWEPGKAVQILGVEAEERLAAGNDQAASLDPITEYFYLTDYDPDLKTHVFRYLLPAGNPDAYPHLNDWLHAPWLSEHIASSHLNIVTGAAQQRQIGRYAMFKNAERILALLQSTIRQLAYMTRDSEVNIWLIGSSAGGTGAGCLIDAAYLTRLAADYMSFRLNLTGVIVLPSVYTNVPGISQGHAYSMLRELDRVQEEGFSSGDRYVDLNSRELISSRVVYDRDGRQTARVRNRLFDDLLYLGGDCLTEAARRRFFTSAASAIEPYLDSDSGPALQYRINESYAVSSLGAASICVPTEIFAEIFAWEQVAEYLLRAGAPKEVSGRVVGLHSGPDADRQDNATAKVRSLLVAFRELLELEQRSESNRAAFARSLDAESIVTAWYELTGNNRTAQEQAALLAYANPFISLTEPGWPKNMMGWETNTFKENRLTKGVKETQEESRDRFADRLEEVMRRYTSRVDGEHSFEKGRRYVYETVSRRLRARIDDIFIEELSRYRLLFGQDLNTLEQGSVLTRLLAEVIWMLDDQGPLQRIHEVIRQILVVLDREESGRDSRRNQAIYELRTSKRSSFLSFGAWIEEYQQQARNEYSDYIRWYLKRELLRDLQKLALDARQRLREWERLCGRLFDTLVRRESGNEGEASALFTVTQVYLKGILEERLYNAARKASILISFGQEPDPQMHGYREEMRNQSAAGLADTLLRDSYWEASLTADGAPEIHLVIESYDFGPKRYSAREIRNLTHELHEYFRHRIDERLSYRDVFDYLRWAQERQVIDPFKVADLLDAKAAALINAGGVSERRTLIYRKPYEIEKQNLADAICKRLQERAPLTESEHSYSDRNAITLIKIKKPSSEQFADIQFCREDYLALRAGSLNDDKTHDLELRRAQVFHPFRQEMEAWYIERSYIQKSGLADVPMIPPRVTRLLEDPEMMQIFVRAIATGAVENIENGGWLWHGPEGDIQLTEPKSDLNADVVKAAVNFVLRQGEASPNGVRRISREDARRSVTESAQKNNRARDEMLVEFVKDKLDAFLKHNAPAPLRLALKIVFTFYCDPDTRTSLQYRVNLP
ncbi:MAG TPA: tubulin-like doman-containing protein [Blastocatellia bacterium]|nr:tubulin-like doman-containing protein [Blastocatellia bacterium]